MGIAIVLALVWLRGEAEPVHTAPASAIPVAAAPTTSPVIVESAPAPTWTGQRRATWAYDGSKTITFELQATSDVPIWMSRARPLLVVRCLSRATQAFVVLGTSVNYEADVYHRTIHLQGDDGPTMVQQWQTAESGQELFAPDGAAFVRQLTRVNRLRFGFTPFNAQPVTAEFAVQGFDKLAGLVASTCGWRLDA
jgi:Type VI secretion system VasI, EvfG, VC_A0118